MFPVAEMDYARDWGHDVDKARDDPTGRVGPPSSEPSRPLAPDSDEFLKMMDESLQLEPATQPSSVQHKAVHTRSASSEYPSPGHSPRRMQSPASTVRVHRLSYSDLSRFGRGNDRLSYLRSSSPTSSTQDQKADVGHHSVLEEEASAAISEWRGERRPSRCISYNHYELADSSDVLPCDSLSQQGSPHCSSCAGATFNPDHHGDSPRRPKQRNQSSTKPYEDQLDGAADVYSPNCRPSSVATPLAADAAPARARQSKRKASQFSLRSLSRSLTKRPRFTILRKLANNVYRGGSRRLSRAFHRWRRQNEMERRQFEAWRANRRRERPADPLKGKPEKGFGTFSFERSRYGNEEWWREGVSKYQAPPWLLFQK